MKELNSSLDSKIIFRIGALKWLSHLGKCADVATRLILGVVEFVILNFLSKLFCSQVS